MRHEAHGALADSSLLGDLDREQLEELAPLTRPWRAVAGELVLRQGEPGDRLLLVTSGRLGAFRRGPGGEEIDLGAIGPGEMVGELALLAGGRRIASTRALEDSAGLSLSAQAFELLHLQTRPVAHAVVRRIGESALGRLRLVYETLAERLDDGDAGRQLLITGDAGDSLVEVFPVAHTDVAYLARTLFFQRFPTTEIEAACAGLRVLSAPRGAPLQVDGRLWIVLRGAVETLLDRGDARRRVRIAGPGRCVGHLGLLDDGAPELPLVSALRERAVLLELPIARARALMDGEDPWSRRFADAFHVDVMHAALAAETPQAPVIRHLPAA
ncbi:MAG TPA: cyclic nucleotide-binding domain-containing protein [Thermoleophilaceae bacterium]